MSENTNNNKNVRDDEIDLLDLFRRMGRGLTKMFNALGKAFLISVVFLIRRWLPLGLSILAGIGVSYLLKRTSTSFYSSDIVFRNNLVQVDNKKHLDVSGTTFELMSKINKLHSFCSEGNKNLLSKALSVNPEELKNISDISAFWIIDRNKDGIPDNVDYEGTHNVYDTLNIRMPDIFDVRVNFVSFIDMKKIQYGILNFIESDSLNQLRNKLRLGQNIEMQQRILNDIKQLDSLQKVKVNEESKNIKPVKEGQIIFMQDQRTQLLYGDIQGLYSRKQALEKEHDLYKNVVTVLNDFSVPVLKNSGTRYYSKQIVPAFFLATLLVLIILANRKKLNEIYKKY